MSKKINQYLLLKTLKKIYKGTTVEKLVKDARYIHEINPRDIEESQIHYYLTDKLIKFHLKETMKEEKTPRLYQFFNSWKIRCNLSESYLAENSVEDLENIEIFPEEEMNHFREKQWEEDDLQLDTYKGPGYLRPKGFNYK